MIIAVVGSGGKTTHIHELIQQYRQNNLSVFVCTTTHMLKEDGCYVGDDADEIIAQIHQTGYCLAGNDAGKKISALSDKTYQKVSSMADVTLIEADGAHHYLLKYPRDYEPVIPDHVDEIHVVTNLKAVNHQAVDVCHHVEMMKAFGIEEHTMITYHHIQMLLEKGYLEMLETRYPDVSVSMIINHNDTLLDRVMETMMKQRQDVLKINPHWFDPKPQLMICGAGHVSKELANIASLLDFEVTVIDSREEFLNKERFSNAHPILDDFENLHQYLKDDAYYVIVTRGHQDDHLCLTQILNKSYHYLGMIGSHKKVAHTFQQLKEEGYDDQIIESIHAPVGLAIGAQTPAEIAISILAQIIQVKNQQSCSYLSDDIVECLEPGTLCIITDKTGSTPRGVGSMMYVLKDKVIGTIGGGSIEYHAILDARKCQHVDMKTYCLDSNEGASLGMICGGNNTILFIPLT